jgi:hypothetical protein
MDPFNGLRACLPTDRYVFIILYRHSKKFVVKQLLDIGPSSATQFEALVCQAHRRCVSRCTAVRHGDVLGQGSPNIARSYDLIQNCRLEPWGVRPQGGTHDLMPSLAAILVSPAGRQASPDCGAR